MSPFSLSHIISQLGVEKMGVSKVGQREFFSLKTPFITEETSGFEKKRKDFFKTKIS